MNAKCRTLATGVVVLLAAAWFAPVGRATADGAREELDLALAFSRTAARSSAQAGVAVLSVRAFAGGKEEYGSAVLVDESGLALTVEHLVAGATSFAVVTRDGEEFPARLRAMDATIDLALLEILAPGRRFPIAQFGNESALEIGESVIAIGNPFGLGGSVSLGVLSAKGRVGVVHGSSAPMLQTDAAINPGCSGGALVDLEGRFVGLIDAILTRGGNCEGVGFAIPVSEVAFALPFLIRGEAVKRAWLGLRAKTAHAVEDGVEAAELVAGGPAEAAGLKVGDRILRLDGVRLGSVEDLRAALKRVAIGSRVAVSVRRADRILPLSVVAGEKPAPGTEPRD